MEYLIYEEAKLIKKYSRYKAMASIMSIFFKKEFLKKILKDINKINGSKVRISVLKEEPKRIIIEIAE